MKLNLDESKTAPVTEETPMRTFQMIASAVCYEREGKNVSWYPAVFAGLVSAPTKKQAKLRSQQELLKMMAEQNRLLSSVEFAKPTCDEMFRDNLEEILKDTRVRPGQKIKD